MRQLFVSMLLLFIAAPVFAGSLQDGQEKLSYAIGMSIGSDLLRQDVELDLDKLSAGITAAFTKVDPLLTEEEMVEVLVAYQQEMQQKQMGKAAQASEENRAAGQSYLDVNAKKEGVVTLESGLQYKILQAGQGKKPVLGDLVKVNYTGKNINGNIC